MEPNQNPPCEREWTIEEQEEFFASQDAVTGLLNGVPKQPPIEWNTSAWNGPIIELDPDDPFGHMRRLFGPAINITSIVPPESGWPIVAHCELCRKTVIVLSPWAVKPEDGDYWKMNGTCLDEDLHIKHNMYPQKWYPWGDGKIKFQVHDPLPLEGMEIYMRANHISTPYDLEFTQEMPIKEAKKRWPNTPVPGEEK
jgi:hypothetical protein